MRSTKADDGGMAYCVFANGDTKAVLLTSMICSLTGGCDVGSPIGQGQGQCREAHTAPTKYTRTLRRATSFESQGDELSEGVMCSCYL